MSARKYTLLECSPRWGSAYGEAATKYLTFDCPEGHAGCWHTIPFTPTLDGSPVQTKHATWARTGDVFESLTLTPSIRRIPRHASREAAIAAGCLPEYVNESLLCALHVNITGGKIQFHADSR